MKESPLIACIYALGRSTLTGVDWVPSRVGFGGYVGLGVTWHDVRRDEGIADAVTYTRRR